MTVAIARGHGVKTVRLGIRAQPRAATYTFWKAERPGMSSGAFTSGLAGSAGLPESEEQAFRSASSVSTIATQECRSMIPHHALFRFRLRWVQRVEKSVPGISAELAVGSVWARLAVFMASFL